MIALFLLFLGTAWAQEAPSEEGDEAAEEAQDEGAEVGEFVVQEEGSVGPDPSRVSGALTVLELGPDLSGVADLGGVLQAASGTTMNRLGGLGAFSALTIRGSSFRQVLVCLDGVPLNPDGSAVVNLSELSARSFSRVEIYRSNPPPEFGAAPMGGVVNLVTTPSTERSGAASAAWASHGTGRIAAFTSGQGDLGEWVTDTTLSVEGFRTRGDFAFFDDNGTVYDDSDDEMGVRSNNDKSQLTAHGRFRVEGPSWRLTLQDALLARDQGLAGHTVRPTDTVRYEVSRNLVVGQVDGGSGALQGRFRLHSMQRTESLDDRAGEIGVGSRWTMDRVDTFGALAHGSWIPGPNLAGTVTLDGRYEVMAPLDRGVVDQAPSRKRWVGTATAGSQLWAWDGRVRVDPIVRAGLWQGDGLGEVVQITSVDPRGGVLLRLVEPVALKGTLGRSLRVPDLLELYGDSGSIQGNPGLAPERAVQWDAGFRVEQGRGEVAAAWEASWFDRQSTDLITWIQNAQRTLTAVNLDAARVQGVETALDAQFWDRLQSRSSLTWIHSQNLSEDPAYAGNQLPRIPEWEIHQSTTVRLRDGLSVEHRFTWLSGNYWDATNWFSAPPRPLHGARVRIGPNGEGFGLELSGLNLANHIVEQVPRDPLATGEPDLVPQAVTDFVGYPLAGRTLMVRLRWTPPVDAGHR